MTRKTCFKAYDIRGIYGTELDGELAHTVGRAFVRYIGARAVAVGGDVRLTTEELKGRLIDGILDEGCDVFDLGTTGTEEVYFATFQLQLDGGVQITASHNPKEYNGMKIVREGARPVGWGTGLEAIEQISREKFGPPHPRRGKRRRISLLDAYIARLLRFVDFEGIRPLKILLNPGNGAAGHVVDALEKRLKGMHVPIELIKIFEKPDGNFPHGVPNPLLVGNREATSKAVLKCGADFGVAWDGDFDRCFFFDEKGAFVEGYYVVGLLASMFLAQHPGEKVVYDPRVTWNTEEVVRKYNGIPVLCKSGHSFMKTRMRAEDALYGGEMSAHHYFRDFNYCDSGMVPWLMVANYLGRRKEPLSHVLKVSEEAFPCSGELNFRVKNTDKAMERILQTYGTTCSKGNIDRTDGLSVEFPRWRFNLRPSNTEPYLRLNVETRGDLEGLRARVAELSQILKED